jgi:hypothetical protein
MEVPFMGKLSLFLMAVVPLSFILTVGNSTFGKELYEADKSEEKVKDTMTIMQDDLDDLDDAIMQENVALAVKLTHELDEASHFICHIDLERSTLSKDEQEEFERLRKTLHRRLHGLTEAADKGDADAMLEQSFKVREACDTCHHDFKKGKG